jgi:hypothetical protein
LEALIYRRQAVASLEASIKKSVLEPEEAQTIAKECLDHVNNGDWDELMVTAKSYRVPEVLVGLEKIHHGYSDLEKSLLRAKQRSTQAKEARERELLSSFDLIEAEDEQALVEQNDLEKQAIRLQIASTQVFPFYYKRLSVLKPRSVQFFLVSNMSGNVVASDRLLATLASTTGGTLPILLTLSVKR